MTTAALVRAYVSPTLVLLAMDWPDGATHTDFLGFSIERTPGYDGDSASFLTNKIGFTPRGDDDEPLGSDVAPIQKFNWWDGGLGPDDVGESFTYTVTPMVGTGPTDVQPVAGASASVEVTLPDHVDGQIGTYFNRAVVSSQAFARIQADPIEDQMAWLANGIETVVPSFLERYTDRSDVAIYHLTDTWKIVPAFEEFPGRSTVVYFFKPPSAAGNGGDDSDVKAVATLRKANAGLTFKKREHIGGLMHDKFIVGYENDAPAAVLMGSMNFTPEAQTVQANLLHTIESPELASAYASRHKLLAPDPRTADVTGKAAWTEIGDVEGSEIRVFFPPEKQKHRESIDAVVDAVKQATSSVLFCMYAPTDDPLLSALLDVGDQGKVMFGLLNSFADPTKLKPRANGTVPTPDPVKVEVFNRTKSDLSVVTYDYFRRGRAPAGFLPELSTIDTGSFSLASSDNPPPTVHVHHKFIVIDADTEHPVIYTGSANMSANSTNNNDENLLEIKGNAPLAQHYLAEFMRLYNQYRARARWDQRHQGADDGFLLATTRKGWVKGAYKKNTADWATRVWLAMAADDPQRAP